MKPPPERSALMARVGPKDTKPEMAVRKLLHGLGYRYRLHRRDLPGTPDLCFPSRRKAIFVHGCFWHRHEGCRRTTDPKTRASFWKKKFEQNVARDQRKITALRDLGWDVLVVWECEAEGEPVLAQRLMDFLAAPGGGRGGFPVHPQRTRNAGPGQAVASSDGFFRPSRGRR